MADTARPLKRPSNVAEFLEWEEAQRDKHEFRHGQIRMMTGGTQRHNLIAGNIFFGLRNRMPLGPCRAYMMNARVALEEADAGYYPDVVVDCGTFEPRGLAASKPTVVFQVLSPTTRNADFSEKVPDYRDTESIVQIVLVEPDEPKLHVWTRANAAWRETVAAGLDKELVMPSLSLSLAMSEIYAGALD